MSKEFDLNKLSKNLYKPNGTLRTFGEQLYLYKINELKDGDYLIVSKHTKLPFIKFSNNSLPLVITQNIIKKIETKHKINGQILEDTATLLESSPLALESKDNYLTVVLDINDKATENITQNSNINTMVVLRLNNNHPNIIVNDIRSIYANDIQHQIDLNIKHNRNIYTNDKTQKWLDDKGIGIPKLPADLINDYSIDKPKQRIINGIPQPIASSVNRPVINNNNNKLFKKLTDNTNTHNKTL
jgi:hypothetical protein